MDQAEKIYTWWFDASAIILRYLFLAGMGYFIFYVWFNKLFSKIKIQKRIVAPKRLQQEIIYSCTTLLIYCGASWVIFFFQKSGFTKIYLDIHQFGYLYFGISILLMIILHDTYFYWTHRLLHRPGIYNWSHRTHHLSDNPTPWSAFSFHPAEAIISIGIMPVIVFLIPSHPFALFSFLTYMTLMSVMGHLGYETFPQWFRNSKIGKWQNTSTNHNFHHQSAHCNYGLYFTFWDRIMNTYKAPDPGNESIEP